MRELALRGGPWSAEERAALLDYCQSDVLALTNLLTHMERYLNLPHALLRGRYSIAAARIERTGTPIDVAAFDDLRDHWDSIKDRLIARVDSNYGVFEGPIFKSDRWQHWLETQRIDWARHPSGRLSSHIVTINGISIYRVPKNGRIRPSRLRENERSAVDKFW